MRAPVSSPLPAHRSNRRTLVGEVVSTKMDKTAVVAVVRAHPHPHYHKIVRKTTRFFAHDPFNAAQLGDIVRIEECRHLSKNKYFRIVATLREGNVAELAPRDVGKTDVLDKVGKKAYTGVEMKEGDIVEVHDVPPILRDAYAEYVSELPESRKRSVIPFTSKFCSQQELVGHLADNDDIGKEAARVFLESCRSRLTENGTPPRDDRDLVEQAAAGFSAAAAQLRSRNSKG